MKKHLILNFLCGLFATFAFAQVTISPSSFDVTSSITITASFASATCNTLGTTPTKVYMHAGIGDDTNAFGYSVKGNWGLDDGVGLMTNNGNGTWSITLTPSTYFGLTTTQQTNATKLGMVFRNADGTQTLKLAPSCGDFIFNVGLFQVTLNSPTNNSSTIITSGGSLNIAATNTNGNASYVLSANGTTINTNTSTASYSYTATNITTNTNFQLQATIGAKTITRNFSVIIAGTPTSQALPSGLEDGINYNSTNPTKATLVLTAPGKDFVYVAGSFNNYLPSSAYLMKKDPTTGKFWLELTGLVSGAINTFQYWVVDQTPTSGSQAIIKCADPFSTLVLSPYDDPDIPSTNYPNLPAYPTGQQYEVSVLQTGQTAYNWQVTNFTKPAKEKLTVYEVLIRDFDANRSFQSLIDRMSYFKNLKVNAIELMPVMEFEGNLGWGYNPSFHLALDKFYGTKAKMQEFVDLCHQNGIAVILDVALNHAFGRNPLVRMWQYDPNNTGYGTPATDNPYFNTVATHSYGVGNDFNHSSAYTKYYTQRVIKQWVTEFKIDGFRWDLTKGFTQNCSSGDDTCTNNYQQDRVDILKGYADYSWLLDPNHYVIFEHLGISSEEQQWANYRISETPSKGVMMWGEMTAAYTQLIEGYSTNADISAMLSESSAHGFTSRRLMGYSESHDKDRLMYGAITYGNSAGTTPLNNLTNALARMSAIEATSILIPGPKMIWHFQDLGMSNSIYTCNNGTINTDYDNNLPPGDCKLDTKPQPQWTNNWLNDANRSVIYNNLTKMNLLKQNEPVFLGSCSISPDSNNVKQRIYIYDNTLPSTSLKNVVILANFSVASLAINPSFPYTGTWYNLLDNTTINVTNTTATITIPSGQFLIYGNKPTTALNNFDFNQEKSISLYPNPAREGFRLDSNASKIQIYAVTGQLVKAFDGVFDVNYNYPIDDLKQGIYLVKVVDDSNREQTLRLIKQ